MYSRIYLRILVLIFLLISISCSVDKTGRNAKPYARYWWFASEIQKEDVRYNMNWLKENGFGGVEIAWVYPLNAMDKTMDTTYTPRQAWLGPEWQEMVNYTILYADSIGLACNLTFGTLWPFGDSYVSYDEAARVYGEAKRQMITRSWEYPRKGYVVDHLNPEHYLNYFDRLIDSFPQPETHQAQSYFIDSWEVETKKIWTDGLDEKFQKVYGYDISLFMDSIYNNRFSDHRYDYMRLISEKVITFYSDFDSVLNENGISSRGQCSGAPCDILSAYAKLDIPEGEAMLYEPEFSSIPASSALLSGKDIVSAETFTCLYGWPRHFIRQEQTADLKMVADALFANGINQIVWHGKPHNPMGYDTISFYASVHAGKDGVLASEILAFNNYLAKVSTFLQNGNTYSDIAVYLPTEDAWMKGIMPKEKQFIWAWGYYEMRYVYFPEELMGYHPIWINHEFLETGTLEDAILHAGNASFTSLYIDVHHLQYEALLRVYDLAKQGLKVTLKKNPLEPGVKKHDDWEMIIDSMKALPNVTGHFISDRKPLVEGNDIPPFWARVDNERLYIFFANPKCLKLSFPIEYGQSLTGNDVIREVIINYNGRSYDTKLQFEPYQSLLFAIDDSGLRPLDIRFLPQTPKFSGKPLEHMPWLVE